MFKQSILTLTFILLAANAQQNNNCCEDYCYSTDSERSQTKNYATKTAYDIAKGSDSDSQRSAIVPGCQPVKFWLLARHGTRLPGANDIDNLRRLTNLRDDILENYRTRRTKPSQGALCDEDLELLQNWRWNNNVSVQYESYLTEQGWNDLKFLALHYRGLFPSVLQPIYDRSRFLFRHTNTERTEASYKAFVEGLFGDRAYENIQLPPIPPKDYLLRPYDICPAYQENSKKNKDSSSEYQKFLESPLYKETVSDISVRLGFRYTLQPKQIEAIWDMCRYEQAWHVDQLSPWCSVLTKKQVDVLEYSEDVKNYYKNGYGESLNSKVACHAASDMLKHLSSDSNPIVIAYFTHDAEVQLFLTAIGAKKDFDALRADNFYQMTRRKWHTGQIAPFAANLAAIKYQCDDPREQHKIIFFLNQKPLDFEWCRVGLCNWSEVQRKFEYFNRANCDNDYCSGSFANQLLPSIFLCVILALIVHLRN
uniref:Multiple inositol polyphosphate phosphatase 1 n=1 Tax=Corethrella appendiculata TaxID=1370023 RepID=U5EX79_9DIPT